MRAVVREGQAFTVQRVPDPVPGPGEAVVEVAYAGVNFADLATAGGVPGSEVAGVVTAVGEGVHGLKVGERVAGFGMRGAFAERTVGPASALFALPAAIDLKTAAAAVMQGITAYHCLLTAGRLAAGDRVLILAAAGGVGGLAVQWARRLGAGRVYGVASTPAKREHVLALGADRALSYEEMGDLGEASVDLFLDSVGGEAFTAGLGLLAPFGRVVVYGAAGGPRPPLDPARLIANYWTIAGSAVTVIRRQAPDRYREAGAALWQALGEGWLKVPIDGVYPLEEAGEALDRLKRRQSMGKLLLKPQG